MIGADGARSAVAKQCLPNAERVKCVFAYHEIIKSPEPAAFGDTEAPGEAVAGLKPPDPALSKTSRGASPAEAPAAGAAAVGGEASGGEASGGEASGGETSVMACTLQV